MIQRNSNIKEVTITKFHNHKNAKIIFDTNIQVTDNVSKIINFINEGTIINNRLTEIIRGDVQHFTNHGTINAGIIGNIDTVTNTGTMGGISADFTINNTGTINLFGTVAKDKGNLMAHIVSRELTIQNYSIRINENQATFNSFSGYKATSDNPTKDELVGKTSHLVVSHSTGNDKVDIKFGANAKIFIDIDLDRFQLGRLYSISKILTDEMGNGLIDTSYFKYLTLKNPDIYEITQNGDSFVIKFAGGGGGDGGGGGGGGGGSGSNSIILHTPITGLYKANIRTMNNFYTMSNSIIFPRKSHHSQNLGKKNLSLRASEYERGNPFALSSLRDLPTANRGNLFIKESIDSALDSANPLKSYESFAYRSESQNRRIQRQNKRNYNRKTNNAESSVKSQGGLPRATSRARNDNFNNSVNESQNLNADSANRDYYFILTPFVNYNSFNKAGNYTLSGFDYGFLTAFSGKLTPSNSLGAHFMMSYGNLGDSKDKDFNITNLNLNVGVNYKLDLIWDMFIKARGDFFYFLNQVSSASVAKTNADNLGFGLSVSYGKDFDFKQGGVLGIEVGIDYKALRTNDISVKSALDNANMQDYQKSLVNLIYADLGANYVKYFGGFGINVGLGFRANLASKLAKTQLIIANNTLNMLIDNDKFLGYANAGISYVINKRDFDMEFSLQYYGNFGDRGISNGGGVEWRVLF